MLISHRSDSESKLNEKSNVNLPGAFLYVNVCPVSLNCIWPLNYSFIKFCGDQDNMPFLIKIIKYVLLKIQSKQVETAILALSSSKELCFRPNMLISELLDTEEA